MKNPKSEFDSPIIIVKRDSIRIVTNHNVLLTKNTVKIITDNKVIEVILDSGSVSQFTREHLVPEGKPAASRREKR